MTGMNSRNNLNTKVALPSEMAAIQKQIKYMHREISKRNQETM